MRTIPLRQYKSEALIWALFLIVCLVVFAAVAFAGAKASAIGERRLGNFLAVAPIPFVCVMVQLASHASHKRYGQRALTLTKHTLEFPEKHMTGVSHVTMRRWEIAEIKIVDKPSPRILLVKKDDLAHRITADMLAPPMKLQELLVTIQNWHSSPSS